jgi:plasmid maintenance system antidote protein VapI
MSAIRTTGSWQSKPGLRRTQASPGQIMLKDAGMRMGWDELYRLLQWPARIVDGLVNGNRPTPEQIERISERLYIPADAWPKDRR